MKCWINGNKKITLTQKDYLGGGGQGAVYVKQNIAYKIYFEPTQMIPLDKIRELQALDHPCIIRPLDIINDEHRPIGYTMHYIPDTYVLCQLFPKIFKQREHVTLEKLIALVDGFKKQVDFIHQKGILIVDANEMNFLVSGDFTKIYFIDVDSYQTHTHGATAIMETIRDRQSPTFTPNTDWFSWGIITFQLFTGIHPYKGKHPQLKTLDERMTHNVSVFNKAVRLPAVCEPLDKIPALYRDWYYAVFEQGKRCRPPFDKQIIIQWVPQKERIKSTTHFSIHPVQEWDDTIIDVAWDNGCKIVGTDQGLFVNDRCDPHVPPNAVVIFPEELQQPVCAWIEDEQVHCYGFDSGKRIPGTIHGEHITAYENRLYVKSTNNLFELHFTPKAGGRVVPHISTQVMERATRFYAGVVIQEMLDAYYASFFPRTDCAYQVKLHELTGYKIIDARYDNQVLMVIGHKNGRYDRFIMRFNHDFYHYDMRIINAIQPAGLNFIVLNTGIVVHYDEEDNVEIFRNIPGNNDSKVIPGDALKGMRLIKKGNRVMGLSGNHLYTINMEG